MDFCGPVYKRPGRARGGGGLKTKPDKRRRLSGDTYIASVDARGRLFNVLRCLGMGPAW
jgi:hypothetical protein